MNYIGIDSVLLTQTKQKFLGKPTASKGLVGIGIEVKEKWKFKEIYDATIKDLFLKYGLKQRLPVYCAHKISKILETAPTDTDKKFMVEFRDIVLPYIEKVYLFYTYIFGLKTDTVSIFGATRFFEKIPLVSNDEGVQDFYDLLAHSYPMLCAWELQTIGVNANFLVDHFQGRLSPAWAELNKSNLTVYNKGDECNPIISTADIFTRLIKYEMLPNQRCFSEEEVKKIKPLFQNKLGYYLIGTRCLKMIVPNDPHQIDTSPYWKHPIIFIKKENPKEDGEETIIENSPLFSEIVTKCHEIDGSFKYFNASSDTENITIGDMFAFYGDYGEKTFEKLKNAKYRIRKFQ